MNHSDIAEDKAGLGVIIPAAGVSARMGRPKLLLPWGETTVVGRLIGQWRELGAAQVGIVCRAEDAGLAAELDRLGFPAGDRIINPQPERGMFSSIQCAAQWAGWRRELGVWAIALGDQPHLRTETLRRLIEFQREHPLKICQPEYEGKAAHPVLLPAWARAELSAVAGGTLKDFLKLFAGRIVQCPVNDPGLRLDMDTPEDYKRVQSLMSGT